MAIALPRTSSTSAWAQLPRKVRRSSRSKYVSGADSDFLRRPKFVKSALDQHLAYQRWYYDWAREGVTYPILERALDWLAANRPDDDPSVLNWGDSRIGNILFDDFG